jgi:hypothetical protein
MVPATAPEPGSAGSRVAQAADLALVLRLLAGLGLFGFGVQVARHFLTSPAPAGAAPSTPVGLFGPMTGLVTCALVFVPWSQLPGLQRKVHAPGPYLAIVSKLLLSLSLCGMPYLLVERHFTTAALAAVVAFSCIGLWVRLVWVVWIWYGLVLLIVGETLRRLWILASGGDVLELAFSLLMRSFGLLLVLVLLLDLVRWHRERLRMSPQPAPDPAPPEEPTPPPA